MIYVPKRFTSTHQGIHMLTRFFLSTSIFLYGCGEQDNDTSTNDTNDSTSNLTWYATCGDPVCSGYNGPFADTPLCSEDGFVVGDTCQTMDETCDLVNDCNGKLLCTNTDPATNCPISQAKHKRNIEYLGDAKLQELAEQALSIRIAEWNYNWDKEQYPPRLGFIIDDNPNIPAVHANRQQVDLYGYTTMTLALLQQQAKTINHLEDKVKQLEQQLQQSNK